MNRLQKTILTIGSMLFCAAAYAVPAKPGLIAVTQPDGSIIHIELKGDEFLHWKTAGGKLVEIAADGYVYYASFDNDGYIRRSNTRVGSTPAGRSSSKITLPQAALYRAQGKRNEVNRLSQFSKAANGGNIAIGSNKFLTILVEFPNMKMKHELNEFVDLLNKEGYSVNKATGSARDFYRDNSDNQFNPEYVIVGPYMADHNYEYYGQNVGGTDAKPTELFAEIVKKADKDIDYSQYDADGNGVVDNLFFYYAGHNEAEGGPAETIWPHKYSLFYEHLMVDGKDVMDYACTSELRGSEGDVLCGIGTFCHEFGHVLGLPDFYDTDYGTNGLGKALGDFSLMSGGGYLNEGNTPPYFTSFEREMLGWSDGSTVINEDGEYVLENVQTNKSFRILTSNEGEYFQLESRGGEGWDKYIPTGMLIYHIDKSENYVAGSRACDRWITGNGINDIANHQCCDLIEACGKENMGQPERDIFPGSTHKTKFTSTTKPAFKEWSRKNVGLGIVDIVDNKAAGVSFRLTTKDLEKDAAFLFKSGLNAIYIPKEPLKAGDKLYLEIAFGSGRKPTHKVEWEVNGKKLSESESVLVLEKGIYNITARVKYEDRIEILKQRLNIQ